MKKLSILFFILTATCLVTIAQPRAIGGRIAYNLGASYQHGLGEKNMLQVDLDFPLYFWGIQATATYNWIFPIDSWTKPGTWNWYAGVGGGAGYIWGWGYRGTYGWSSRNGYGFVGVAGMIGVEYNFNFPLQLSLEWRPLIGPSFHRHGGPGFYYDGLYISALALGVRYKF